jgi:hypothetical protein
LGMFLRAKYISVHYISLVGSDGTKNCNGDQGVEASVIYRFYTLWTETLRKPHRSRVAKVAVSSGSVEELQHRA